MASKNGGMENEPLNKKTWEQISGDVQRIMRRLAWHNYCRSRWSYAHNRYSVTVDMRYLTQQGSSIHSQPLNNWHYKAWEKDIIWPRQWNKICADFQSPVTNLSTNNHITQAVIHCCQVKRRAKANGWLLDLELVSELDNPKSGRIAYSFLYFSLNHLKSDTRIPTITGLDRPKLMTMLYRMRTKGGGDIQIIEMSRSRTRKKGIAENADTVLRMLSTETCYVTFYSSRKGAHIAVLKVNKIPAAAAPPRPRPIPPASNVHTIAKNFRTKRNQRVHFTLPEGDYEVFLDPPAGRGSKIGRGVIKFDPADDQVITSQSGRADRDLAVDAGQRMWKKMVISNDVWQISVGSPRP